MKNKYILTDTKNNIYEDNFFFASKNDPNCFVKKFKIYGGQANGMDVIVVNNGKFSYTILPTRGMGIWKGEYNGIPVGWDSPVRGPVHPAFINLDTENGLGWLAGFDEVIVRCGLQNNGAPGKDIVRHNDGKTHEKMLPLHGRIANLPAHYVEIEIDETDDNTVISVIGEIDETMLFMPHFRLKTKIVTTYQSNSFEINDEVINFGTADEEFELLYHCNFGPPFLEEGAEVIAPIIEVAPRDAIAITGANKYFLCDAPKNGFEEKVYFYNLAADDNGNTITMLKNKLEDKAVVLRFNKKQLPWFTLWKNTAAEQDGYVVGLEPGTDFPNNRAIEREKGRLLSIPGGSSYNVNLKLEVLDNVNDVSNVKNEILEIQKDVSTKIHLEPIF